MTTLSLELLAAASIPGATRCPEIKSPAGPPLSPLWGTGGGGASCSAAPSSSWKDSCPSAVSRDPWPGISHPRVQSSRGRSVGPCLKNKTEGSAFLPLQGRGHSKSKGQGSLGSRGTVGWGGGAGSSLVPGGLPPAQKTRCLLWALPSPTCPPCRALQDVAAGRARGGRPDRGGSRRRRPGGDDTFAE